MTEREACERIVIDGGCSGVLCSECPLLGLGGGWNCNDMDEVRLAGLWLAFHPIEEKEMGYEEKQAEWLKANGLEEGSRVYVYRKAKDEEGGWGYIWLDSSMDDMVGKVARIMEVTPCSLRVEADGNPSFYMPYTALLPVGVTEFEAGRRYKYVGARGAEYFRSRHIPARDAELIASGTELIVEAVKGDGVKFTATSHPWYFTGNWADFVALPEKDYCAEPDLRSGDKARTIKVFRKRKMMETLKDPAIVMMADHEEWAIACDGMSVDFLRYIGLIIKDEWCEEVEL
jgi:hypothetical protein